MTPIQLYSPYNFWVDDFFIVFRKFNISVAMTTNQIEKFALRWYVLWRTTQHTFL